MVACKILGEYRTNQEKNKKFCLEEAKKAKQNNAPVPMGSHSTTTTNQEPPGPSRMPTEAKPKSAPKKPRAKIESTSKTRKKSSKQETNTRWPKEKILIIATKNQTEQQPSKAKQAP